MKNKKILISIIPVLVLLLVYLGGAIVFSNSFLPNTFINDEKVSGKTVAELENNLQESANSSNLVLVKNDDSTEEIKLSDVNYSAKYTTDLNSLKNSQSSFTWPVSLFKKTEFKAAVSTSFDSEKLNSIIDTLRCVTNETIQEPINAHLEKTPTGFTVVDAIDGNKLNVDTLKTIINEKLSSGVFEINLDENNCYLKANIKADDPSIKEQMGLLEKFNGLEVVVDLVDASETIDFNVFNDWIVIENDEIKLDEDKLYQYGVNLSVKYNTFGTIRKFNATDVGEIEVGGSQYDSFGFQLDINKTIDLIREAILNAESKTVEAVWKIPGKVRGNNDIGDTYIEVDLTRQHMWYYEKGKLKLESDIKSGRPTPERETPTGAFRVWSKEKGRYLTGASYRTWVDYWMPFTWTGCGIHDAQWTTQFGGDYYKYSGSHGCLNTPFNEVKQLYEMVDVDTPVIVYKS